MREAISGLVGTAQNFHVLDSRLEACSRNCEPSVVTGRGGVGERAKGGIIQGMLAKPATVPTSSAAVPFVPRPGQKNGALENRRAQGSLRGPWQWEIQVLPCSGLNCQPFKLPVEWAKRRQIRCLEGELAHLPLDSNLK